MVAGRGPRVGGRGPRGKSRFFAEPALERSEGLRMTSIPQPATHNPQPSTRHPLPADAAPEQSCARQVLLGNYSLERIDRLANHRWCDADVEGAVQMRVQL